jgi:hypothetical protein
MENTRCLLRRRGHGIATQDALEAFLLGIVSN